MKNHCQRRVALHEAGHAVACERLGIEPEHATIRAGENNLGHVRLVQDSWIGRDAPNLVLMLCSGYAALVVDGESERVSSEGCVSDFDKASTLIDKFALGGDLDLWKAKAVAEMRKPANKAAVELIAKKLSERVELPSDYISVLVEVVDGTCTLEEAEKHFARQDAVRASACMDIPGE